MKYGVEIQSHTFSISAAERIEWSASRFCRFTPGVCQLGRRLGPKTYLHVVARKEFPAPSGNRIPVA
jgi:hypothetical protein